MCIFYTWFEFNLVYGFVLQNRCLLFILLLNEVFQRAIGISRFSDSIFLSENFPNVIVLLLDMMRLVLARMEYTFEHVYLQNEQGFLTALSVSQMGFLGFFEYRLWDFFHYSGFLLLPF